MSYTPYDIYNYIKEKELEFDFLQALSNCKNEFSIGEITDREFVVGDEVRLKSKTYNLDIEIQDEDISVPVRNGVYVSAFISRYQENYNVHFLVHKYPVSMKETFDESILKEVLEYMILMTIVQLKLDTLEKVTEYIG